MIESIWGRTITEENQVAKVDHLPWFMRLTARARVSYQVALEMHRALVGWPCPEGHGVKSQGMDYVASPVKMPRHEPCLTRSHMPTCSMNKPSYLVPFMRALPGPAS